jgi:hypothetical protein
VVVLARLLVLAVRVLGLLLLARFLFAALRRPGPQGRPRETGAARASVAGELVRDRVCNTFLPRDRAIHAVVGSREEHFCSAACRDRALADAARAS